MNNNNLSSQSQSASDILQAPLFQIDEPEFARALTAHAIVELFSRLSLPDRVFLVFVAILALTRGMTERQSVAQGAIAGIAYNLVGVSTRDREQAIQRVGRYINVIVERQRVVVVQVEPGAIVNNKKHWSIFTAYAWGVIHDAIEYLPVEMPDVQSQFRGMKTAMDRALDEFEKGSSRLVGRLGKRRMPLSDEQRLASLFTQIDRIINAAHLSGEPGRARKFQMMEWERLQKREDDLRAWEGRLKYKGVNDGGE